MTSLYVMPYASEEMRSARVEAGLTRRQLAEEFNISESHVRNVENGYVPIRDVVLSRIAKRLERRLADLLADPPDQPRARTGESVA
jgi:transcriptional regulator with XRE-family HTH domain